MLKDMGVSLCAFVDVYIMPQSAGEVNEIPLFLPTFGKKAVLLRE
jgi:hypothetical protein